MEFTITETLLASTVEMWLHAVSIKTHQIVGGCYPWA
jgi:hypothetical protein